MERLGKPTSQQADAHYRAVIRALVAEALELSTFLEKVSQGTNDLRTKTETTSTELDQLQFSDWVSNLTTVTEGRQEKKNRFRSIAVLLTRIKINKMTQSKLCWKATVFAEQGQSSVSYFYSSMTSKPKTSLFNKKNYRKGKGHEFFF